MSLNKSLYTILNEQALGCQIKNCLEQFCVNFELKLLHRSNQDRLRSQFRQKVINFQLNFESFHVIFQSQFCAQILSV